MSKPVLTAALRVDPATGAVHLEGASAVLVGGMARAATLEALQGVAATLGGQPVALLPCFEHGELAELRLGVDLPGAPVRDGWPTQAAIEAEVAFVRAQLQAQLGTLLEAGHARWPWGEVWSLFDAKGWQATAGVRWPRR